MIEDGLNEDSYKINYGDNDDKWQPGLDKSREANVLSEEKYPDGQSDHVPSRAACISH